eukprot:m.483645 g.483645  ORF g.483645 m.483645 type:complete len:65 (+) comp23017_c0_seq1:34-228(+)
MTLRVQISSRWEQRPVGSNVRVAIADDTHANTPVVHKLPTKTRCLCSDVFYRPALQRVSRLLFV